MNRLTAAVAIVSLLIAGVAHAQPEPVYPAPPPPPGYPPAYPAPPTAQPGYAPPPPMPVYVAPPSTGVGYLVVGGILLGVGVLNLVTAPICKTDVMRHDIQNTCLYASLGIGGVFIAAGIPLTIVGAGKRRVYNEWARGHRMAAALVEGLGFGAARQGGSVLWSSAF